MRVINDIKPGCDYLKDESQLIGNADKIYFCHNTNEIEEVLSNCYKNNTPITIQGALTGICGGAVPLNGVVINLSEMNNILGMNYNTELEKYIIKVQSGLLLKDLNHFLKSKKIDISNFDEESIKGYNKFIKDSSFMFPTDPTETLASIGGMVACDASGACSYKYGSIRKYIQGLTLVTPTMKLNIERGKYKYSDLEHILKLDGSSLPKWQAQNQDIKDVAGLYYDDNMDLIDLIIGGEGIFGVITEIELILIEEPKVQAGVMLFLNEENELAKFVDKLRNNESKLFNSGIAAIEYFDSNSLKLLNRFREVNQALKKLPIIQDEFYGSLYLEFHLDSSDELDELLMDILEDMNEYGINEKHQWLGIESSDFEKLKLFRHAVPECVNILIASNKQIDSRLNKLGTDMSVPNDQLLNTLLMYQKDIEELDVSSVIFGHIGDNHLHVNLLPNTYRKLVDSKKVIINWANYITSCGGSVTAEHGIGKLKKELLKLMLKEEDINSMRKIKGIIEPKGLLNQGTLLD
ncbi:putative FAD-linked oxidoreductase [Candidatus Izimaplasma bacterium HR1]|jgi:D-lactate dehydrogenase (cytochrome)|uniref:FAD-binding oxidoreductase n=1 Tax=Candidatus Izimoplasma sp. HR1 TaxID=1541959 RepID=UPI0004F6A70C|nr:putative FAD-linked oxidoreductase [Candidatus Izimaplasma bacterium HR1]